MFTQRVREQTEIRKRHETWSAEVNGYEVLFHREDDGYAELAIYRPREHPPMRLGIIECHPKSVADLEHFAAEAGALLAEVARELREAGLDDLRSASEKWQDEFEADRERRMAKIMDEADQEPQP